MGYTTRDFFENKTDRELFRIYSGGSGSTINEKEWAEKILKERNFDFKNVQRYKLKWEFEKLNEEVKSENSGSFLLNLWYNPTVLKFEGYLSFVIGIIAIIITIREYNDSRLDHNVFLNIGFSAGLMIAGLLILNYSVKLRKRQNIRDLRIAEIKRELK